MDDLRAEFSRLKLRRDTGRKKALEDFHDKLSRLTFFDPACGCGNFLVIAYRELRDLEIGVLSERFGEDKTVLGIGSLSTVNVDQFFGIEIEEFSGSYCRSCYVDDGSHYERQIICHFREELSSNSTQEIAKHSA